VVDASTDDTFTITVTEEEMTSLLANKLAEQKESPVSQPQVHFRNGRIEIYATVTVAESLALPGLAAFSATAAGGEISVTLEEIALGPLPVPEPVLEALTELLNESISRSIMAEIDENLVTDIQIEEGEMTISGQLKSD